MNLATRVDEAAALAPQSTPAQRRDAPRPVAVVAVILVLAVGVWLRFWTRSHLWLDEALTVDIARLPLADIPGALRHDGAPPLYYFGLHLWMRVFGSSPFAARALGGLLSVVTIPVMWFAGRRFAADTKVSADHEAVAWAGVLLLSSSPFAVHFATEARMYSLVVLLVLLGYLGLSALLRGGRHGYVAVVGTALCSGLLLLTHYWALYLLAVLAATLAWKGIRAPSAPARRRYRVALGSVLAGGAMFVPWLPSFAYQARHTGTPWAEPASFSAMVNAISEFAGGRSSSGRGLGLLFFALAGFGLFGAALDRSHVEIDLRTRRPGRGLAIVVGGTLAVAIGIGLASHGAFAARYTSVVFPPFLLLVALGLTVLHDPKVRTGAVAAAVLLGMATSTGNVRTDRTQIPRLIAAARLHGLEDGDVMVYCPDQLGPAGTQVIPSGVRQLTFPTLGNGRFVDWVDYGSRNAHADPVNFAETVHAMAGPQHAVWIIWAAEYRTFGTECEQVVQRMGTLRPPANQLVASSPVRFFEHANLVRYPRP
ncbi:MAG: hypothetical protein NVSMB16_12910 [Acidimicrobiales bacterium]